MAWLRCCRRSNVCRAVLASLLALGLRERCFSNAALAALRPNLLCQRKALDNDDDADKNLWRSNPEAAFREALARADTEWSILQAQVDAASEDAGRGSGHTRAVELLAENALDRLRPYVVPARYVDIPPLRGGEDALEALLGEDAILVTNFLSKSAPAGPAVLAFWQAELYLRQLQKEPGEMPVQEAAKILGQNLDRKSPDFRDALDGSLLLARQNFISAARFGYFLRRGRQRWQLERGLDGDDFLAALKKKVTGTSAASDAGRAGPGTLEVYLKSLTAEQAVELVRVASHEGAQALEYHATSLFGSESELLAEIRRGPDAMSQLTLSSQARGRLAQEAAAFGAALFDAEAAAARLYRLDYTAYGSRSSGPPE